ncbi:MAG: VOC family protein [Alphaproteobacteria bacterium]|nr:VOC family protein [Alphaproteobacteria bacterium]
MPRVAHFEIHASEPAKLAAYYRELFGWRMQHLPHIDYWMIDTSEGAEPGINGGLLQRRGPKPADGQAVNAFMCTVSVASVDTHLAKAIALGGTEASPKMAIPGVGWVAYAKDPDGNIFGLHQEDRNAK